MSLKRSLFAIFVFLSLSFTANAQFGNSIHVGNDSGLEKEFSELINDLELRNDQKLALGIIVLKYTASFDFNEFEDASKSKQYAMARSTIRDLDKDLKEILDKRQFKVYKKHKKKIKKELMNSV